MTPKLLVATNSKKQSILTIYDKRMAPKHFETSRVRMLKSQIPYIDAFDD